MKQTDYEWMLFGCHPVSDVAMAYCSCEHTTSSTRAFRKLVKLYPRLYEALCRYGYTERTTTLVPLQIAAIIREWGMPGEAFLEGQKLWGIERSGFFNGREKWAKGFENQRV